MKKLIILFVFISALCSCVSKSKYEDLETQSRIQQKRLEESIELLKDRCLVLERSNAELQEQIDELTRKVSRMKSAMQEAHSDYYFYGATHFFTKCSIDNLVVDY